MDRASRILNTADNLPDDDEIKERLKELHSNRSETEKDSDTSDDSDFEGSLEQAYWDVLFPDDKPFENTLEDLKKMLNCTPSRLSTRQRRPNPDNLTKDLQIKDEVKKILGSKADIDQDIAMENLERIRVIINKRIQKRTAVEREKQLRLECVVKLERMKI